MAKVSLRIYDREIERLIEQGATQEAIAHCRHILKTFPKHLETYRLLGKAFLESRRYNEAVDVFGRVLMSVPDDFVAHVGLSIVRDEENKLDDSIWHMERAFEAQPSNAAIQGELQRLYGRRDGMEPPKIRMTRGALAHMYVQGELYPQAIAEIRAVLAQDSQRSDMQVLLATAYFKGGQKSDAADICNQLLKRYPYCFDANRIMVDLIPATAGVAESTQVYRMRVGELDPYASFVKGSMFQVSEVTDASVSLDRLEYSGDEVPAGQEWTSSLGSGFDATAAPMLGAASPDEQPDWLRSAGLTDEIPRTTSVSASSGIGAPPSDANEGIPDFLRTAGWAESNAPEKATSMFDEETAEGDLVPADLPDWLKGQAPPSDDLARITGPRMDNVQPMETPDWLTGLGGAHAGGEESADTARPANVPDWLSPAEPNNEPAASIESLGSTAQEQDDAVAWLESLAAKHGAKPEELVTDPNQRHEEPPEWVAQAQNIGQQTSVSQPNVEDLGATAEEQDDAVAWLESLAAKHGAKPEELVTDPNRRSDIAPEWVQQAQSLGESQPAAEESAEPAWVEGAQDIGEQFFAEFETASIPVPTDETGTWLRGLGNNNIKKDEQAEQTPLPRGNVPDWLSEPTKQSIDAADEPDRPGADLPNWLGGLDQETAAQDTAFTSQTLESQDLSSWLSGLDDEPGLDFDPEILRASARPPFATSPEKPIESEPSKSEIPDWLSNLGSEPETDDGAWKKPITSTPVDEPVSYPQAASISEKADLPDWLRGVDEIGGESGQVSEDESAPWQERSRWEAEETPQPPKPTSPSDWRSLAEVPADAPMPALTPVHPAQPLVEDIPPQPSESVVMPSSKKKSSGSPRQLKVEGQGINNALTQAKGELDRGDIPAALDHYGKLIKKGKHLEETISDLTESIYRYPVEVGIWQTLGDAYMRANRLKEALESYNKAEELIR